MLLTLTLDWIYESRGLKRVPSDRSAVGTTSALDSTGRHLCRQQSLVCTEMRGSLMSPAMTQMSQ